MKKIIGVISKIQNTFATLLFFCLLLTVSLQIISRFIIQAPIRWTEEGSRFLFLWVALMGACISVQKRTHFLISIYDVKAIKNRALRVFLEVLPEMIVFAFCIFITYYGWLYFLSGFSRRGIEVPMQMSWVFAAIPVSGITMAIYTVGNIFSSFEETNKAGRPGTER